MALNLYRNYGNKIIQKFDIGLPISSNGLNIDTDIEVSRDLIYEDDDKTIYRDGEGRLKINDTSIIFYTEDSDNSAISYSDINTGDPSFLVNSIDTEDANILSNIMPMYNQIRNNINNIITSKTKLNSKTSDNADITFGDLVSNENSIIGNLIILSNGNSFSGSIGKADIMNSILVIPIVSDEYTFYITITDNGKTEIIDIISSNNNNDNIYNKFGAHCKDNDNHYIYYPLGFILTYYNLSDKYTLHIYNKDGNNISENLNIISANSAWEEIPTGGDN